MRTARFPAPGEILVEDAPDPVPGAGEVLVRVRAAGVCGSDLHEYRARQAVYAIPYPRPAQGHEFAGEVVRVGTSVTDLAIGDRVAVQPMIGCGHCRWCIAGRFSLCPELEHLGVARPGGFAELCVVPRANAFPLPASVSLDEGALLDCVAVAVHAIHRVALPLAARVVVLGAGAIGLAAAQVARAAGAGHVTVAGRRPESLAIASALGADAVVDVATGALGDVDADVVIETAGGSDAVARAVAAAGRGAMVGLIGEAFAHTSFDFQRAMEHEVTIAPCWSYDTFEGRSEFLQAIDLVATGRVRLAPAITHRFALEDLAAAFAAAADRGASHAVKVLVEP